MMTASPYRMMLRSATLTVLCLVGGFLIGGMAGNMVFEALPGHSIVNPSAWHIALAVLPALIGVLIGSAVWGVFMGRLGGAANRRRMAVAGALGFAPVTLGLGLLLNVLEPIAVQHFGAQLPIHRLFTLLFVPAVFISAGISAAAIGLGLKNGALALSLFWRVAVAAALAFLIVNLLMEAFGWIVGAPRAADRLTMLTVMFTGNVGAALVGGAVLGWTLSATPAQPAATVA